MVGNKWRQVDMESARDIDDDWKTSETKVRNIITDKLGLDGEEISI